MSQLSFDFKAAPPAPPAPEAVPETVPESPIVSRPLRMGLPIPLRVRRWLLLLPRSTRQAALYMWTWRQFCLSNSDRIDEVRALTESAWQEIPANSAVIQNFSRVVRHYRIPYYYAEEFLKGVEAMSKDSSTHDIEGVLQSCYRLGGTFGMMAAHLVGLSHAGALKNVCDLGMAIQMAAIIENLRLDSVRKRLMDHANEQFASGRLGIRFLAIGPAFTASLAGELCLSQTRPGNRLINRALAAARAVAFVLSELPVRIRRPWKPVPLSLIWEGPFPRGNNN